MNTENKNFYVITASAGSGKTFTLVKEYLKIILTKPFKYNKILAVTFTNKAAGEMKERIIKSLTHLSDSKKYKNTNTISTLLELLEKETNLSKEKIEENAQICLSNILHNYSEFAVLTIDSFSYRIIRAFSFEMNINEGFELEMKFENLVDQAVKNIIDRVGKDEVLTKMLFKFVEKIQEDENRIDTLSQSLKSIGLILKDEHIYTKIKRDKLDTIPLSSFDNIIGDKYQDIKRLKKKIKDNSKKAIKIIEDKYNITDDKYFAKQSKGLYAWCRKQANSNEPINVTQVITDFVENPHDYKKWEHNKNKLSVAQDLAIDIHQYLKNILQAREKLINLEVVFKNIYAVAFIFELVNEIENIKHSDNIVPLSEFNSQISKIVSSSHAPFIYERIGEKYEHYMIDEFQDTSILQWQNFIPLIENSLSNGLHNLIVGDGKQAIYRWRNGEVKQFIALPKIYDAIGDKKLIAEREKILSDNFITKNLNFNYRSYKNIVEFNNKFFCYLGLNLSDDYNKRIYSNENVYQNPINNSAEKQGYVDVTLIKDPKELEKETNTKILNIIKDLVENRNYKYSDIAILVRRNELGNKIASFLMENKINVASPDSMRLNSSLDLKAFLSLFKVLTNQSNEINLYEIIVYLSTHILNNNDVYTYFLNRNNSSHSEVLEHFISENKIDIKIDILATMSAYEICDIIIDKCNIETDIYIDDFMNKVQSLNNLSLISVIPTIEEHINTASSKIINSENAVIISSIHKSKGLEFPIVIFPYADFSRTANHDNYLYVKNKNTDFELSAQLVSYNKKLEDTYYADEYKTERQNIQLDNINLYYVACTRAKRELYIIAKHTNTKKQNDDTPSINKLLNQFFNEPHYNDLDFKKNEEENVFILGLPTINEPTNKAKKENYIEYENYYCNWRNKLNIALSPEHIQKQELEENKEFNTDEILFGKQVHYILSLIKKYSDIDYVINKIDVFNNISEANKEPIIAVLRKLQSNKEYCNLLFDYDKLYIERELYDNHGKIWRADRIVRKANKLIVIDYKTGAAFSKYQQQIDNYCDILRAAGEQNVSGHILYL